MASRPFAARGAPPARRKRACAAEAAVRTVIIVTALSFFDEDDEPRSSPRPRRSAAVGRCAAADQQTLLVRRALAIGGVVLLLFLLFFVVRSCASSRKENALRTTTARSPRSSSESDSRSARRSSSCSARPRATRRQDLQTNISGYRVQAESQLKQAKALDVPDEMKGAQQSLLMALEFRRDGLGAIAEKIRTALGDEGDAANTAITQIAGADADVPGLRRALPGARRAADQARARRRGDRRPEDRVLALPARDRVAERADGGRRSSASSSAAAAPARPARRPRRACTAPGSSRSRSATPRSSPTRRTALPASADTRVRRQASPTRARTTSSTSRSPSAVEGGDKPIKVSRTVDTVAKGQTAEATLALGQTPPTGAAVTVKATVGKVPGEQKTDNNTAVVRRAVHRGLAPRILRPP